jgi:alkylresorcinol/alkylpyrone synthase
MLNAHIAAISTAVPPHVLDTAHVIKQAGRIFARFGDDFQRMLPVFQNAGIGRRYSACPTEWFDGDNGWPERSKQYLEGACNLFRDAATKALVDAHLKASDIDAIITISSTGIATPSIEARVMHEMGFRLDVVRLPVFGLGCAGGVSGIAVAAEYAKAKPGRKVLMVVIELCTLAFRSDEVSKANIIATALFGDGAAALVISTDATGPMIEHAGQHCWPETLDVMGWRMDNQGFGAILSRDVPDIVLNNLRPVAETFLTSKNLSLADLDAFTFHPGGMKVIQSLETTFELPAQTLKHERDVLNEFGNMSSPTVIFILKRALADGPKPRRLVSALGPGFTATFVTLVQ